MPLSTARELTGLARALADREIVLDAGADWDRARHALLARPAMSPGTAETIAMRALGDPDAFPADDVTARLDPATGGVKDRARRWSPWRAYACQYLARHPGSERV